MKMQSMESLADLSQKNADLRRQLTELSTKIAQGDDYTIPLSASLSDLALSVSDKEESLTRRYKRKNLFNKELVFEFTRDPGLLHQYYQIRSNEYKAFHGEAYETTENEYDRSAHIMVARIGNFCVGGVRINTKTPRNNGLLPMEKAADFRIEEYFPELRHQQVAYGEVGDWVLLPEFRGGQISDEMTRRIFEKASALNIEMLFVLTSPLQARLYKQVCIAIGLKDTIIHYDIALSGYPAEGDKSYLLSVALAKNATDRRDDVSSHHKQRILDEVL